MVEVTRSKIQKCDRVAGVSYALYLMPTFSAICSGYLAYSGDFCDNEDRFHFACTYVDAALYEHFMIVRRSDFSFSFLLFTTSVSVE